MKKIVLGLDFGSTSVSVLTMNLTTGKVLNTVEQTYKEGENGVFLSTENSLIARQKPADYVFSMKRALKNTRLQNKVLGIEMSAICGIGVDATGSTPLPVTKDLLPLSELEEFKNKKQYIDLFLCHPLLDDIETFKNRCPSWIICFVCILRKSDGWRMGRADPANNVCHNLLLLMCYE